MNEIMEKRILALRRGKLFGKGHKDYFEGFKSADTLEACDIGRNIETHGAYYPQEQIEGHSGYKQIVTYCTLFERDTGRIFSYKRAGVEKRLEGMWSLGVGGHVYSTEKEDELFIKPDPITNLDKEVNAIGYVGRPMNLIGYINCDDSPINKDHFGILYFGQINNSHSIKVKSTELSNGHFRKLTQTSQLINEHKMEEWSEIAFNVLMKTRLASVVEEAKILSSV